MEIDGQHRAYPLATAEGAGGTINDSLGGTGIVVLFDRKTRTAAAFKRLLEGRVLEFVPAKDSKEVAIDKATGSRWRIDGRAVGGPLRGRQLEAVKFHTGAWYSWAAYFPNTSIYGR